MTIRIVMGTALSGKTHFIKENFPDSLILSVGEYQRKLMAERKKGLMPLGEYRNIIQLANDQIKKDMLELLAQGKDVILEHTLYKAARRKEYVEAFRTVTSEPIDIYVMQPSDERLLQNIQKNDEERERGIEWIKSQMREIEIPSINEGFAHVYVANGKGIQDWSDKPMERKFIDKNTKITLFEKGLGDEEKRKIVGFGDKPFKHICESCGKVAILTSNEAYEQGWDYPGDGAVYPSTMFGVLSPRTCGNCGITETAYWAIVVQGKTTAELSENQLQAVERIMQEPDILLVDGEV
ncbi:MAG TPA: AAA family ATPase [Bacillota bacterium]|nr:AAA family ATPase [Bacillota bacterium]HQQ44452.1 AAA family ATPase [Bacillota bacterium]